MKNLFVVVFVVVVIVVFLNYFTSCEITAGPKLGQIDSHYKEKDGKIYFCQSYLEIITNQFK